MGMSSSRNTETQRGGATDALLDDIRAKFPAFAQYLPLSGGIEQELSRQYPDDPTWRVIAALRRHVNEIPYLKSELRNQERFNLMGDPVGEVTPAERAYVRSKLRSLEEAGEVSPQEWGPLEDMRNGQRLLLSKQVAAMFGEDTARQSREYLERIGDEGALEDLGVALLSCELLEDWLDALETRVPEMATD